METDLFWHERYMAGCSLRLMRRPWRFLLDVILWNNTCQLLPDPRRGGRFSRSSCHLSAKAHLSLSITTWSVLTGLTGRPASLAQWEPGKETAWGHHLWCWDLIITEVMKMCTQIETLLNKFMEQAILCFPLPSCSRLPRLSAKWTYSSQQKLTVALTWKPMASPSPMRILRECTSICIWWSMPTEEPTWGEQAVNLGEIFFPFTAALVIFCQSSLLSNFKAVLIVAGLKIRFHCGGSLLT